MESQRLYPESETGESQAAGGPEKVCPDGARTRRRCEKESCAHQTQGEYHGKAEAEGGGSPLNTASAFDRAPELCGKSQASASGVSSPGAES